MKVVLLGPFSNHGLIHVLDEHVDVFQCTDGLQSNPILEPHHSLLTAWSKPVDEELLHIVTDELPTLISDIASVRIRGDDGSSPDDNMSDIGGESIGPVVGENTKVGWVFKGDLRGRGEWEGAPGLWQAVLHEVARHAAIASLRLGRPFYVLPKVRRLTLQSREVVDF